MDGATPTTALRTAAPIEPPIGRRRPLLRMPIRPFVRRGLGDTTAKPDPTTANRHALYEDALAILSGTLLVSLGIALFIRTDLMTGGIAGVSLLVQHLSGIGFWFVFFTLSLPFYWFAWKRMGRAYVARTFLAIGLECVLTRCTVSWLKIASIAPLYAAIIGGLLIGTGILMLYRHSTSLGGIGILAVYLQDSIGVRAGYVQLGFDLALLSVAALVLPPRQVVMSVVAALVTNVFVAITHRPGRYAGFT